MWSNGLKFIAISLLLSMMSACQSTAPLKPEPEAEKQTVIETTPEPDVETKIEAEEPDPSEALFKQALWLARSNKTDEAIEQFQQLVSVDPSYRNAYTNLGLLLLQKQNPDLAKKALLNAIDQDKRDSIAYNNLAIIERQQGSFKQALEYYKKALDVNPDYANAHLNLGILMDIYLQDLPQALRHYKSYQGLTENADKNVGKWVIDIQRRIDAGKKKTKG